jgi:hypothetical protein
LRAVELGAVFSPPNRVAPPAEPAVPEEDRELAALRRKRADSVARIDRLSTYSESLLEFRSTFEDRVNEIARELSALGK